MKILICGCGDIGETLARELGEAGYDLTIMDSNPAVLESGINRYDVMAIQGNCASMEALQRAGVKKSKLLIACTGSDELNLLCCLLAKKEGSCQTIARLKNPEYSDDGVTLKKIPFKETKNYVKKISRASEMYEELYSIN